MQMAIVVVAVAEEKEKEKGRCLHKLKMVAVVDVLLDNHYFVDWNIVADRIPLLQWLKTWYVGAYPLGDCRPDSTAAEYYYYCCCCCSWLIVDTLIVELIIIII